MLCRSYAVSFELPLAIVRCANIYGGGDLNWSRLIPGTIRSALRGEEPVIRSDGTLERDYLYVDDAVDAYLTLAEQAGRADVRGQAFNFGWGKGFSVLEIVDAILRHVGVEGLEKRILGQNRGEIVRQWLDAGKAERVLGWRPAVTLDEGISRSVAWYRQHLAGEPAATPAAALG